MKCGHPNHIQYVHTMLENVDWLQTGEPALWGVQLFFYQTTSTPFSHYLRSTLPTETLMCQDFRNQRLFFLRRLKRFGMVWEQLQAWPQSPAESHQSCSAHHRVSIAIHAGPLYPEEHEESWRNHKGPQPHQLHTFLLLPSGKLYRARSSRLRDIFYPQAVRLLNSGTLWKYFLSYTHTLLF